MSKLKGKLTYANVMASVAVFVALGAGAYAAGLPKNSVKSKQIKPGAVKNADLAEGAVTSAKVADGSLLGEDFAAAQLPRGPQGEQGPPGVQGPSGTARAHARVFSHASPPCSPTCFVALSKGITQVTRLDTGDYCVRAPGLSPTEVPAVASVDWSTTTPPEGNASAMVRMQGACPASDFQVNTSRQPEIAARNAADNGSVAASGLAVDADNVGFTIIIP